MGDHVLKGAAVKAQQNTIRQAAQYHIGQCRRRGTNSGAGVL
jgi:hypothetical protein